MESIRESLQRIAGNTDFTKRYEQLKRNVTSHKRVREFLKTHPELSENAVDRGVSKLFEFVRQSFDCDRCAALDACPNVMKGYYPRLFVSRGQIEIRYERCRMKRKDDEIRKQRLLFQGIHIPKEIMNASMDNLDLSEIGRSEALEAADQFVQRFQPGKTHRGLYLHGKFGVGKTYIMGAIANELAQKKNVQSLMVHTPELFRELKMSIQDQTVNEKLDYIKTVPVLILDDIGAEGITPWIRDDVLGAVLQYRMMEKLPTLYTSNWNYDELEKHLAFSQKYNSEEGMKAKRIMERIRHLTTAVKVSGKNMRAN